jgi:hypothetical protein
MAATGVAWRMAGVGETGSASRSTGTATDPQRERGVVAPALASGASSTWLMETASGAWRRRLQRICGQPPFPRC